jgi:hypothetical protein
MAQRFKDEAGNIWEVGEDGQPRLVQPAPRQNLGNPKLPFEMQQAQGQAAAAPYAAPTAQANLQGQQLTNEQKAQSLGHDRLKIALDMKKQFESDSAVALYKQSLPELAKAVTAAPGAQGDINVVYSFAKVMDPGSVVREGEIQFANASASLVQRVRQYLGAVQRGKGLDPEVRNGLIKEMNSAVAEYNKGYSSAYKQYSSMARGAGFDPAEVIGNHFGDSFSETFDKARGGVKEVNNPEQSAALAAMIRGGVSYEDAAQWAQSVGGNLPREQYEAALAYAKQNPGQANAEVFHKQPLSGFEQVANALPIGEADIGIVKGGKEAWDRAAMGLEGIANMIPGVDSNSAQQAAAQSDQVFAGLPSNDTAEMFGRLGMSGILAAPLKSPAIAGAAGNLLMTDSTDPIDMGMDAAMGAVGGVVGDKALRGLSGLINPQGREAMQRLNQQGVNFTPGQVIGPRARNWEDRFTANPILGPKIDAMREEGLDAANRILPDRALGHIGQQLPENVKAGQDAVGHVADAVGDFYEQALRGKTINIDKTFVNRMNALGKRANMRPQDFGEAADIIEREVAGAFQSSGTPLGAMSGRQFKQLDEKLGDYVASFSKSDDPYKREVGRIVADARDHVRGLARRQSPDMAKAIRAADNAWAEYSVLRRAASATPETGIATPGQLRNAVRQNDRSAGKGATARGNARAQDLARDMSETMPSTVGSSGTSEREQAGRLLPYVLGTALSPLYSKPVQNTVQRALLRNAGPEAEAIANGLSTLPRGLFGAGFPWAIESQFPY